MDIRSVADDYSSVGLGYLFVFEEWRGIVAVNMGSVLLLLRQGKSRSERERACGLG